MSDLDEALQGIFIHYVGDRPELLFELEDELLPKIKQAFVDEGWLETFPQSNLEVLSKKLKAEFMTGQEFYDRFKQELSDWTINDSYFADEVKVLAAAKKAAGL